MNPIIGTAFGLALVAYIAILNMSHDLKQIEARLDALEKTHIEVTP